MIFQSSRFGEVEVDDSTVLTFPEGVIGFPQLTRWVLIARSPNLPIVWLHSVEDEDMAFPVALPHIFYPEFECSLERAVAERLELSDLPEGEGPVTVVSNDQVQILSVITAVERLEDFTINLRGPVIINQDQRLGAQTINLSDEYEVRAPLWAHVKLEEITDTTEGE